MMNTIYVYRPTADGECSAVAYAEDGEELARHYSSNLSFFRNDMGLNGDVGMGRQKHVKYRAKYPDGFKLVEVIGRPSFQALIDAEKLPLKFDSD